MKFNLFRNKEDEIQLPVFVDKTFMTTGAKMNACAALALQDASVVFITWFQDSTRKLKEYFIQHNIDVNRIIETKFVHHSKLTGHTAVFAEHYPIHSKETELVKSWDQKSIVVYTALDEALFIHFGGEKIMELMLKIGINENEMIEHPMISKSIQNIQEKIAEKVIIDQFAASQTEWVEKNLK